MTDITLKKDFSKCSPLEQLAAAAYTLEDMLEIGLLGSARVDGVPAIHKIQRMLATHGWRATKIDPCTRLEARVYQRHFPTQRYATLTVGSLFGIFGDLEISEDV